MNDLIMQIVLGCAGIVVTACVTYATKKITAWLAEKQLLDDVKKAIDYAEQLWKVGTISKECRKDTALLFLKKKGVDIPEDIADMLIESVIGGINAARKEQEVAKQ